MSAVLKYNMKSPAVKRLMREASELSEPTEDYFAQPLDENLFEWHFTVRGPSDSSYSDGLYHGKMTLPTDYPMKPPSVILFTPNGRFAVNQKICLSISGHHPETWQPSWSIRTALLAIIGFMPTESKGSIGALDYSDAERRNLAKKSVSWKCPQCGPICVFLKERQVHPQPSAEQELKDKDKELAKQICFKNEEISDSKTQSPSNEEIISSSPPTPPTAFPSSSSSPNNKQAENDYKKPAEAKETFSSSSSPSNESPSNESSSTSTSTTSASTAATTDTETTTLSPLTSTTTQLTTGLTENTSDLNQNPRTQFAASASSFFVSLVSSNITLASVLALMLALIYRRVVFLLQKQDDQHP